MDAFVAFLPAVLECGLDGGVGVVDVEPFVVHIGAGVVAVCCDVSGVLVFPEFEAVVAADGVAADSQTCSSMVLVMIRVVESV